MLDVAIRAARAAGDFMREQYQRPQKISVKGLRDIVTEADLEAEAITMREIRRGCPEARFVTEESHHEQLQYDGAPTWYIDPIDGTTNFARGVPEFSVSIGMAQDGKLQCGAVLNPITDQMFYAERGGGAFLNGQPLRVSQRDTLMQALASLDWPREPVARKKAGDFLARVAPEVDSVRSRGSAALGLCAIAAGWTDVYFQFTLLPWDVAAGIVIVQEAGGQVTDLHGAPYRIDSPSWLVSNGLLHEPFLALEPFS